MSILFVIQTINEDKIAFLYSLIPLEGDIPEALAKLRGGNPSPLKSEAVFIAYTSYDS